MKEAVVVAYGRSAIGKAPKGTFKDTRPEVIGAKVIKTVLESIPQLDPAWIDDVILGCAFQEAEQGMNMARRIALQAGLPESVPAQTVNRFCSSGLQSIAMGANAILAGQAEVIMAGGVETMSMIPMGGNMNIPDASFAETAPGSMTAMGITAENVAMRHGITRGEQDAFALESHRKAIAAQDAGLFDDIIPVDALRIVTEADGTVTSHGVPFQTDEGVRRGLTLEALAKLKPVFKKNGTVTPGNASQMNDGASAVVLMEKNRAEALGIKPLAKFVSYAVAGCAPEYMGIGPVFAIPKALKIAGLTKDDIHLWELNEAFAAQALACIKELGLNPDLINVNGGGIALGHPLGCTGAFLTCKLLAELKRRNQKYGVVSMCIGGGMGAAGVYEICR